MSQSQIKSLTKLKIYFSTKRDKLLSDLNRQMALIERKKNEIEKIRQYQREYGITSQFEKGNIILSLANNRRIFLSKLDEMIDVECRFIDAEEQKCEKYRDLIKRIEIKIKSMEILIDKIRIKDGFVSENALTDMLNEMHNLKEEFTHE